MPLNPQEQRALTMRVSEVITNEFGFTGPVNEDRRFGQPHYGHATESIGSPVGAIQAHRMATEAGDPPQGFYIAAEQLLFRLDRLADLLGQVIEAGLPETTAVSGAQGTAKADKPAARVGRPPKPKPDAAPQQGAQQPNTTNGAQQAAPPPAQVKKPDAADDMFPTDDSGSADDDPLAIPGEKSAPPPEQPPLTDIQVKEVLRSYMQSWGAEGTPRLTDLLKRTAGVTKFSDLPANKWAAVVDAAKKELAGRA